MTEPSLLDVFNAVVTPRRVGRALLALLALFLIYQGVLGLINAQALAWGAILQLLAAGVLGVVAWSLAEPRSIGAAVAAVLAQTAAVEPAPPEAALAAPPAPAGRDWAGPGLAVWRALRLTAAVVTAFAAQAALYRQPDSPWLGLGLWLAALALWYPILRREPPAGIEAAPAAVTAPRTVWLAGALAGLGLSVVAFLTAGRHLYTPLVIVTWLGGVGVWALALSGWNPRWETWPARARAWAAGFHFGQVQLRLSAATLAVLALLGLGTALRFYELNDVPREMTSDHVEKLLDVTDVLNGQYSTFFPRNTGREPLQFYFTAGLIRLFDLPINHMALKTGTAIAGSVTLLFVFLLARELGGTELGLWALLLSAVTRWPIALSRAGLRYPFAPLFLAPALYFTVRGLKSGRRSDFIWAGICAGAGLHGYSSFRIVPVLLAVLVGLGLIWAWRRGRADAAALLQNGLTLGSVMLLATAPLLRYMFDEPEMFWYRIMTRLGTEERAYAGNVFSILGANLYRVFLMFNFTRDEVWTVNIAGQPIFSPILAGLFGLGFVYLLYRLTRRDRWAGVVLLTWVLLLLPSGLSLAFPNENPSVARAGIVFPVALTIAAWPLLLLRREAAKHWPSLAGRAAAGAALLALVALLARTELYDYYVRFRDQYASAATNPSEVGTVVKAYVAGGVLPQNVWLKGYPYWLDTRSVSVESFGNLEWPNGVMEPDQLEAAGHDDQPRLFIVHIWDRAGIAKLRAMYPDGRLTLHQSQTAGKNFLTYFVPGTADLDENTLPPPP
ncbi:MAG: glycosyltransferase family 39 protein [Anaerolineales bacterium]|nr:glycosyltransferase family 39 protein [Anaerolineales bacterium]